MRQKTPRRKRKPLDKRGGSGFAFFLMTDAPRKFSFPRRALEALLDVLFPRECPVTGEFPGEPRWSFLSESASALLNPVGEARCPHCGAPCPEITKTLGECVFCRNRKFHFGRSRSAFVFDEAAKRLVHAVKYDARHAAAADLAKLAAEDEFFVQHIRNATLVPVPLFPSRLNARGYNQSLIFARFLSRLVAGTRVEELLVRTRDTGTQTQLSADERRRNVRGAFAVPAKLKRRVSAETRYVVIDDVFTTGSTLSECAHALKKSGARDVDAATFAHG